MDASNLWLSEEQVLSCTGATDFAFGITISGDDCGGGLTPSGANYTSQHSIVPNSSWPYTGVSQAGQCSRFQNQPSRFKARDWGWICDPGSGGVIGELATLTGVGSSCFTPANQAIKQAIVQHGSVVAAMYVGGDCPGPPLCDYVGGVFDENRGDHYGSVPHVDHVIQMIGWDDTRQAWLIKNSWGTSWGENGFGWVAYNTNNIGSFAIWLDAERYNNACNAGPAEATSSAKLMGAALHLDNSVQGKDGNAHFWVYLHSGTGKGNTLASFAYSRDNQPPNDYGTGHEAKETLNVTSPITAADFINQGGNLEIDFHAQLGGFHQNSDWQTGVRLDLIFDDGSTLVVHTVGPIHLHGDESNPSSSWTGQFKLNVAGGVTNHVFY